MLNNFHQICVNNLNKTKIIHECNIPSGIKIETKNSTPPHFMNFIKEISTYNVDTIESEFTSSVQYDEMGAKVEVKTSMECKFKGSEGGTSTKQQYVYTFHREFLSVLAYLTKDNNDKIIHSLGCIINSEENTK